MCYLLVLATLSILSEIQEAAEIEKFFYFAYGSNLLLKRILIKNPSAVFYGPAKLTGYRLDFDLQVPMWNGAVATIVPDTDGTVWGSLWQIDSAQMRNLDRQEGVDLCWYYAKYVAVTSKDGKEIVARTYAITNDPPKLQPGQVLPYDRRPSDTYMKVIIIGAIQSDLPAYYIDYLKTFPTNNKLAPQETLDALGWGNNYR